MPDFGAGDGEKDRGMSRCDVLRARKRSSERMHIALSMRMTTGGGVSPWVVSVAATSWLRLTVENSADEPHGVYRVAAFAAVERERSVWISRARNIRCVSPRFANKLSPKGDRPGVGERMPCPARPVKDDRVLACASALDPCNSGRGVHCRRVG